MLGLKPMEMLLILAVLLLLFGATRLPALGSSLGSAIRNFKRGFGGEDEAPKTGAERSVASLDSPSRIDSSGTKKVSEKES